MQIVRAATGPAMSPIFKECSLSNDAVVTEKHRGLSLLDLATLTLSRHDLRGKCFALDVEQMINWREIFFCSSCRQEAIDLRTLGTPIRTGELKATSFVECRGRMTKRTMEVKCVLPITW